VCSFYPTARGPIANRPFGTLRRKSFTAKKSGPISGATLKRQGREGKSGKAMLMVLPSRTFMELLKTYEES